MITTVKYMGVPFQVEYSIVSPYRPAVITADPDTSHPSEGPEIQIDGIHCDFNIVDAIQGNLFDYILESVCDEVVDDYASGDRRDE